MELIDKYSEIIKKAQKEDDELISNYRQGMTVEVLAKKHGRSVNAIDWRLFRCGELNEEE